MAAVLSLVMGGQMSTLSGAKVLLSAIKSPLTIFFFFHYFSRRWVKEKWREDGRGLC